jgi:catechol 2,3-dioxygenase-like lactoylglutathione lyase family enzyme
MIRRIAPQFFTTNMPATLAYYQDKLGFRCLGTWGDPPFYAVMTREEHAIHFRCVEALTFDPEKYAEEFLDAYVLVEDAEGLHAEFAAKGVEFARGLGETPWGAREFVVRDCDGRLLCFGARM